MSTQTKPPSMTKSIIEAGGQAVGRGGGDAPGQGRAPVAERQHAVRGRVARALPPAHAHLLLPRRAGRYLYPEGIGRRPTQLGSVRHSHKPLDVSHNHTLKPFDEQGGLALAPVDMANVLLSVLLDRSEASAGIGAFFKAIRDRQVGTQAS